MLLAVAKLALMMGLIVIFGARGPRWTCVAVSLAFGGHFLMLLVTVHLLDERVTIRDYLAAIAPPAVACVPMFAVVSLLRRALARGGWIEGWGVLGLLIAAGVVSYLAAVALVARPLARDVLRLVRQARQAQGGK